MLRDVPRTATITATTDVQLLALERDDFLTAVTGHAECSERAAALVASRVSVIRPELQAGKPSDRIGSLATPSQEVLRWQSHASSRSTESAASACRR